MFVVFKSVLTYCSVEKCCVVLHLSDWDGLSNIKPLGFYLFRSLPLSGQYFKKILHVNLHT